MTEELKPCVICGRIPAVHKILPNEHNRYTAYYVECECGLSGGYRYSEAEAVDAWNKRVSDG